VSRYAWEKDTNVARMRLLFVRFLCCFFRCVFEMDFDFSSCAGGVTSPLSFVAARRKASRSISRKLLWWYLWSASLQRFGNLLFILLDIEYRETMFFISDTRENRDELFEIWKSRERTNVRFFFVPVFCFVDELSGGRLRLCGNIRKARIEERYLTK